MTKLILAGAALVAALGVAARRVEGPRIAVVDMSRLVSSHKQSREEQQFIEQWRDTMKKLLDEKDKDYRAVQAELDQFKEGSEEWKKKVKEVKVRKSELQIEAASLDEDLQNRIGTSLKNSYARAVAACKAYQEANDLDAVLQYSDAPIDGTKREEIIPSIMVRPVVSHRKTLDVTDAVLAILDAAK
jgi:Skp family chaperone for outer membrane proteins